MKLTISFALLLLLPGVVYSGTDTQPAQAEWTIMVYSIGDNDLEGVMLDQFLAMVRVGSSSLVTVLVQLDRSAGHSTDFGDWTDGRRFFITRDMTPDPGNELVSLGEVNMARGSMFTPGDGSLEDFIRWSADNYPARKYALIIAEHGLGWRHCGSDLKPGSILTMPKLTRALSNIHAAGYHLDLIGFDECVMAMLEVAYQIDAYVDVIEDNGLTIYFPTAKIDVDYDDDLRFVEETRWIEFLRWYLEIPWLYCCGNIVPGDSVEIRILGPPNSSQTIVALGSGIASPPIPTQYGYLYLETPLVAVFFPGPLSADGFLGRHCVAPTWWRTGEEYPFQGLGYLPPQGAAMTNLMLLTVE